MVRSQGGLNRSRLLHPFFKPDQVMPINPAEKLGRPRHLVMPKAVRQEEIKAMSREQRQRFLTTAARETPRYYPLFFTLAGTGMRLGKRWRFSGRISMASCVSFG